MSPSTGASSSAFGDKFEGHSKTGLLDRPLAIFLIAALFSLPLVFPTVLPLTDLGGHLGRFVVQLDQGRDAHLAQWYSFHWLLVPNLGVDLLVEVLGPLVGLETAIRIIVVATAFLEASGMLVLAKVAHGRVTPFALFALPLVYSHSFLYGFLNYSLALGLLWYSLALWITMSRRRDTTRRWFVFAVISVALWTCHLVGWALLCIAAGAQEFIRHFDRTGKKYFKTVMACILPLSCLLIPWAVKFLTFQPATGTGSSSGFFLLFEKYNRLFEVLRDQWRIYDTISVEIVAIVIIWSLITKYTRLERGLTLAAAVTAICVVMIPHKLLGSEFADQRLIEPALVFALLAIRLDSPAPTKLRYALFAAGALFAGTRLVGNGVTLWNLGNQAARNLTVLDSLPRNSQMINFRELPCPAKVRKWGIDRRTHLGGYAIARRNAFSNDQFEIAGAQLLRIHNPAARPFESDESEMQYDVPCLGSEGIRSSIRQVPADIPYLWVIWNNVPDHLDGWQTIARSGGSVLYRRTTLLGHEGQAAPPHRNSATISD